MTKRQTQNLKAKSADTLRIAIGAGKLCLSSVWSMKAKNCDLYVGVRSLMGSLKFSIHGAEGYRQCHISLTREFWRRSASGIASRMNGRDFAVWAMPFLHENNGNEIASIWLPRSHLRVPAREVDLRRNKPIYLIAPARPGAAVRIRLIEFAAGKLDCEVATKAFGLPVGFFRLDDERTISVAVRVEDFDEVLIADIRRGRGSGVTFGVGAALKPGETLRDLSAVAWTEPRDGAPMHFVELHGLALRHNP